MNLKLWLYLLSQPQCWPFEIAIILMIFCLIRTVQNPQPWKWRYLFLFEALTGTISFALVLYFGSLSFDHIGEFACAGIGMIGSILMATITIFKFRAQRTEA